VKVDEDKIRTRQLRGSVFVEARKRDSKCEKTNAENSRPKILGWKEGSKLLWLECKKGKIEEVKELIEKGAVVNWSPGKREIGRKSIFGTKKRSFEIKDFGKSCLTVAIENVEKDLIESLLLCLLENGANPNMPDHNGHTPLLHAVIKYSGDDIFSRSLSFILK